MEDRESHFSGRSGVSRKLIEKIAISNWMHRAPMVFILAALVFVAVVCFVGLANDLSNRRKLIYSSEIAKLQSHVERTVVRIETDLKNGKTLDDFREPQVQEWLKDHWERAVVRVADRMYAFVEGRGGEILSCTGDIAKSDARVLSAFPLDGFPRTVHEVSIQVGDQLLWGIEVKIPLEKGDQVVGSYATAVPKVWIESRLVESQRSRWFVWAAILLSMISIVTVTSWTLFRLGLQTRALEEALKVAETRRLADLSRLIVGIAHELRNPLNAVRLNLFTSEKLIRGESTVTKEDASVMIRESVSELERVNDLIGQLLGFARVESQQENWIDIDEEIHSVDRFMKQIHQHHGIHLKVPQVSSNVRAKISAKHFKQILLNLLQNARDAMPNGGNIEISVFGQNDMVEIVVQDDGPGIDDKLYEKIFEPFYSTRQDGVGLGLAVVRNLLEVNGGSISSTRSEKLGGMKFQIHLVARFESTGLKASRPVVHANPTNFPIQDTQVMVQNEYRSIHTGR